MDIEDKLFGIPISSKLARKIIIATNEIFPNIEIGTLTDFHLLFRYTFDICNGAYFKGDKLIRNIFDLLAMHTPFEKEFIIDSIATYYHDEGSKDIAISYVQNHDFHNEDEICFIGKDMEERKRNAYEYYLEISKKEISGTIHHHLMEILSYPVWVDKDIRYTVEEKKHWLEKTICLMKTFEFGDSNINERYKIKLDNLDTLLSKSKYKTILKYTNRLSANLYPYLFYIDIVNILYGIFNLKNVMKDHISTTSKLKYALRSIEDKSLYSGLDNLIRNLTYFHEQVNFDQVERYVICYYYTHYLKREMNFQKYKTFCSIITDINLHGLQENSFNLEKIKPPFQFLKFPTLWNNQYQFSLEQFIIPEGEYNPFEGPAPTPKVK